MPKDKSAHDRPYHHGRLRESLVEAGLELARDQGPAGVGLRAASRLAGVSHNAAYRHFADLDALLAAVGDRCMRELAVRMEARLRQVPGLDPVEDAWARLYAIGEAYVEFATTETGWFRTAFTAHDQPPQLGQSTGDDAGESGLGPYQLLAARLDALVEVGAVPSARRPGLEFAAWSAVHGISTLLVDGPLRSLPGPARQAARQVVLDVVARGL
jgi:AcrR family transcriptional regulator